MKKLSLTKKREKWIAPRKEAVLRGKPLFYNASQEEKYRKAILSLVREMAKHTKISVRDLFKSEVAEEFIEQQKRAAAMDESITTRAKKMMEKLTASFVGLFASKANGIAKAMLEGSKQTSAVSLSSSLKTLSGGVSLETNITPKGMEDVVRAMVQENVSLIKSIPEEYLKNVNGAVMRNITTGGSVGDITKEIQKFDGGTERRARNIALDQTRKAYNNVNKLRMQSLGVGKFRWIHTGSGQHPRKSHEALDGQIFSFDNLPVINKEQVDGGYEGAVRGIPGQAINCRCIMEPIIEFEDGEEI